MNHLTLTLADRAPRDADYQAMLSAERRDALLARACLYAMPIAAAFGLLHLGCYLVGVCQ